jgi:AcrR family transcriptional regulator
MTDVNGDLPPARRARSDATRARIAAAAYQLFCERGFAGTTMRAVATGAGVAVQTVYFKFHTKADLLSAAVDHAIGGEGGVPPQLQDWYQWMTAETELRRALRNFVDGLTPMEARFAPLATTMAAAATGDPEVRRIQTKHRRMRRAGYGDVIDLLASKHPLRDGLDREKAVDLLVFFAGEDAFRALILDDGWTEDAWADWILDAIARLVFDD